MEEYETRTVGELLDLSGEHVLLTGASGNIGQGIAARLAEAGATVIAHYHYNRDAAEELIEDIGRGWTVRADLTDESAIRELLADTEATMLVNNAASQTTQSLFDMNLDDWQQMLASNLDSVFLLTQGLAKTWIAAKRSGAIVNIGSIEGLDPAEGHGHYATSKAGLTMFSRAAALEFGKAGIRINTVSPGLIDREGLSGEWPDGVQRWLDRAPLGRIGTPNDVADAVLFLLSPAARWISGINLVVDGGMSTQGKW